MKMLFPLALLLVSSLAAAQDPYCWEFRARGRGITAHNDRVLFRVLSEDECAAACVAEVDFECASIEYTAKYKKCFLSSSTRATPDVIYGPKQGMIYRERALPCTGAPCFEPLGMEDGTIADSQITALNQYFDMAPSRGRLFSASPWCSSYPPALGSLWFQVDLLQPTTVTGAILQTSASPTAPSGVGEFTVAFTEGDEDTLVEILDANGEPQKFVGSVGKHLDDKVTVIWEPRQMRKFRMYITKNTYDNICLRLELLGCRDTPLKRSLSWLMRALTGDK